MASLTIEVTPEMEDHLRAEAEKRGMSLETYAQTVLADQLADAPEPPSAPEIETTITPIWEVITELMQDIPEEELQRLPPDLSENLDHYLYGTPKRQR
jgi:hypothetical protein